MTSSISSAWTDNDLRALSARIKSAQDDNTNLQPFAYCHALDIAAAYAVADRVHHMRLAQGAVPVGRKIGFTNRKIWDEYGVHQPIWGWMYEHTVSRAMGGHGHIAAGRFAEPKIEPEIVFHLASAPRPGADAIEMLNCIDWVAHAFEIVQSHYPGWRFGVEDTIADGGLHGALVLGEPVQLRHLGVDPAGLLSSFTLDIACDGKCLETGRGANVLDSPLNALAHLSSVLDELSGIPPLAAGEIVTTGTVTAAYPIRAGQQWRTRLNGIPLSGLVLDVDS